MYVIYIIYTIDKYGIDMYTYVYILCITYIIYSYIYEYVIYITKANLKERNKSEKM